MNCLISANPMKPAPPVTITVFIFRILFLFCSMIDSKPWILAFAGMTEQGFPESLPQPVPAKAGAKVTKKSQ